MSTNSLIIIDFQLSTNWILTLADVVLLYYDAIASQFNPVKSYKTSAVVGRYFFLESSGMYFLIEACNFVSTCNRHINTL